VTEHKPNLLFINSITIYGGGEVWMLTLIKGLVERGYKVTLVCKPEAKIIEHAKLVDVDVLPIRIAGDFDPFSIAELVGIYRKRKIDIAFANVGKDIRLAGIAAKILTSVTVIALHQVDRKLKNNLRYRFTYNSLAKMIVVNSFATKNTMLKSAPWLSNKKIKVIHHGIDCEKYNKLNTKDLRSQLQLTPDDLIIGFVGRLSVQKGVKYMLDAFRVVAGNFKNAHLVIAGIGELQSMTQDFSKIFNLENRIHMLGFKKDIPDLMRTFDIFLLPSLWEGFGIVLVEAMAAGKPIVATDTSSIPEIVDNHNNGFLVPAENSDVIAEALTKLISDAELRKRFGIEGKKIVQEKFTKEKMINEYEKIFVSRGI